MSDAAVLERMLTVYKGKFWFRDSEAVCYSMDPETGREITLNARFVGPAMKSREWTFHFGPIRVRWNFYPALEIPLSLPMRSSQPVSVSPVWLTEIIPLIREALDQHQLTPLAAFTLIFDADGVIVRTEPDRKSIPPQKE
jgi:hypothetical protein